MKDHITPEVTNIFQENIKIKLINKFMIMASRVRFKYY